MIAKLPVVQRSPFAFKLLVIGLHIGLIAWVLAAVVQVARSAGIYYALASFLGLTAFTLMWLHYLVGWIHDRWWPEVSLRGYMRSTGWIVLFLILLHPVLIIAIFYMMGLGLPPASYAAYAGREVTFIYAAVVALTGFLLYETRRWLHGKPVWSLIALISHCAMLLIIVHGWRLGLTLQSQPLLQVLWAGYAIGYVLLLVRLVRTTGFKHDLKVVFSRKILAAIFLFVMLDTAAVVGYSFMSDHGSIATTSSNQSSSTKQSSRESSTAKTVSMAELIINDGKDGAKCWVAVNGTVYEIVSDEWANGQHLRSNLAYCGADMSEVIKQSPHGTSVLGDQAVIGKYAG